jgi:lysyl-tRNA synthetase class 2
VSQPQPPNDWQPTASVATLRHRAGLLRRTRQFFDSRDFWEVQTPCWLPETVVDAHIEPIPLVDGNRGGFLQTSPEAAMKRLLAAGADPIYQLGPVFRGGECGALHNPEFTMLEWYRRDDQMDDGIELLLSFVASVLPPAEVRRIGYGALFQELLQFDPLTTPREEVATIMQRELPAYSLSRHESTDDWLNALFAERIQPQLRGWTVVTNYPLGQAALARVSDDDPRTAERFELFVEQTELANGYAELTDAAELTRRITVQNEWRRSVGRQPLPVPERLLAAMRGGLPPCSGTALGFDRLVLLSLGVADLRRVLTFPWSTSGR